MPFPAIFLDRDGVLIEELYYPETGETEAPLYSRDVKLTAGAVPALRTLREKGFLLVVVSNQGGVAKGKTTMRELWLAHLRFVELLAAESANLDDAFYSYSHPAGVVAHFTGPSLDRKPSPYNLFIAAARHDIDLAASWMIGDRETDVQCGRSAGTRTIRIGPAGSKTDADFVVAGILEAASTILAAG